MTPLLEAGVPHCPSFRPTRFGYKAGAPQPSRLTADASTAGITSDSATTPGPPPRSSGASSGTSAGSAGDLLKLAALLVVEGHQPATTYRSGPTFCTPAKG